MADENNTNEELFEAQTATSTATTLADETYCDLISAEEGNLITCVDGQLFAINDCGTMD